MAAIEASKKDMAPAAQPAPAPEPVVQPNSEMDDMARAIAMSLG